MCQSEHAGFACSYLTSCKLINPNLFKNRFSNLQQSSEARTVVVDRQHAVNNDAALSRYLLLCGCSRKQILQF